MVVRQNIEERIGGGTWLFRPLRFAVFFGCLYLYVGRFRVNNVGTVSTGVSFAISVYASTDAAFDPGDTFVKSFSAGACAGGAFCGQVVINPGDNIACGTFLIGVADSQDQVAETNESNNVLPRATP